MDSFSVDTVTVEGFRGNSSQAACAGCCLLAAGDKPLVGERALFDVLSGVVVVTACIFFLRSLIRCSTFSCSFLTWIIASLHYHLDIARDSQCRASM